MPILFLRTALGFILFLILVLWWSGSADDSDAAIYCANVHDHTWPDYSGDYKTMCTPDGNVR